MISQEVYAGNQNNCIIDNSTSTETHTSAISSCTSSDSNNNKEDNDVTTNDSCCSNNNSNNDNNNNNNNVVHSKDDIRNNDMEINTNDGKEILLVQVVGNVSGIVVHKQVKEEETEVEQQKHSYYNSHRKQNYNQPNNTIHVSSFRTILFEEMDSYYEWIVQRPLILLQRRFKSRLVLVFLSLIWFVFRVITVLQQQQQQQNKQHFNRLTIIPTAAIKMNTLSLLTSFFSSLSSSSSLLQTSCELFTTITQIFITNINLLVMNHQQHHQKQCLDKTDDANQCSSFAQVPFSFNIIMLRQQIVYILTIIITYLIQLISVLVQDMIGLFLWGILYYIIYCTFIHPTLLYDSIQYWKDWFIEVASIYIPSVREKIRTDCYSFETETIPKLLPYKHNVFYNTTTNTAGSTKENTNNTIVQLSSPRIITTTRTTTIPQKPYEHDDIVNELKKYSLLENKETYRGQVSGTVYNAFDYQHNELMTTVYGLYSYSNPLHPGYWPKISICEAEIICMVGNLLHAPKSMSISSSTTSTSTTSSTTTSSTPSSSTPSLSPYGCITSGGTESILLTIRAHRIYYGTNRNIHQPELICSSSAHAAVDKACDMYQIRKVVINVTKKYQYKLTAKQVRKYITSNTIMIYASAPCYPHGIIDPIEELGVIAQQYNIGLHVDACLGGFVLGFLSDNDQPKFDFRIPGVTSISVDTHKYGYSTKGTSLILYSTQQLRHAQYFSYPRWTGGLYHTPTIAGSRPGGLVACAWASIVAIGYDEYKHRSYSIVNAARQIGDSIQNSIPQLDLFVSDPNELYVVVGIMSIDPFVNIYTVQDIMHSQYGWNLNSLQYPAAISICITLSIVPRVPEFIEHLKCTVQHITTTNAISGDSGSGSGINDDDTNHKQQRQHKKQSEEGTAAIYGTIGAAPTGPVSHLLHLFADAVLSA